MFIAISTYSYLFLARLTHSYVFRHIPTYFCLPPPKAARRGATGAPLGRGGLGGRTGGGEEEKERMRRLQAQPLK
eukprot:9128379-Pyramimonas_sp.AAC.1